MEVTKIFTFDSSHRLNNRKWSKEKNQEVYGKCNNLPSHGHTYILHVTVSGDIDESGMIINFVELSKIVKEHIIEKLDHQFLNPILGGITTCERTLPWIWSTLEEYISNDEKNEMKNETKKSPTKRNKNK